MKVFQFSSRVIYSAFSYNANRRQTERNEACFNCRGANRWSSESRGKACFDYAESRQRKAKPTRKRREAA